LQNLDYRGTFSFGPGYRFFNDDRRRFVVRAGPGVTTELFHKPFEHRTTPDLFGEIEIRWPLTERLKWEQKSSVFPSVSNLEIARAQSQTSLFYALDEKERWSLRFGFVFQFNGEPPKGRETSDYTTNISVVYQRK
jgi:putative salt-induced outer membrane protein YdiY